MHLEFYLNHSLYYQNDGVIDTIVKIEIDYSIINKIKEWRRILQRIYD